MKEEYVSYSQAVALKECGFDWKCDHYYWKCDNNKTLRWHYPADNMNEANDFCSAPHLWSVQKWLRDEKGIDIEIILRDAYRREYRVMVSWVERQIHKRLGITYNEKSYESALSAGLDAALELIKQK